jgi:2-polyprenyl-6-methoxyphenol hydroxylase-like FAD-dependent oxidoreductase
VKFTVIGGGPSGLYFALLAKKRLPHVEIEVLEQNPRGATYGFGIVLADSGLNRFQEADPESHEQLVAASFVSRHRVVKHRGQSVFVDGSGYGGAIARLRMLNILQDRCEQVGVQVQYDHRVESPGSLTADLIVGADGVNSTVRRDCAAFGTTSWTLTNRLAWYGTEQHFPYPVLSFKTTDVGNFWSAAYAYTERLSTFVAECDADTWTRSGFDKMSDTERQAFTETLFAEELGGKKLINNKSAWHSLPVIRNKNWSVGNKALIGDALHSAHPTIGSGTRIAMEDSIALVDALVAEADIAGALALFRRVREPQKQKMVVAAEKSFMWYEHIAGKLRDLEPIPFVFDFMTRTGRINETRLNQEYPRFMKAHASEWRQFMSTHAATGGQENARA